jgi:NagD protein
MSLKSLGYLLDMDGTLYLEDKALEGALELLSFFEDCKIPYCLVTNNSSCSVSTYISRLGAMGFSVPQDQILTSGLAAIHYLQSSFLERVFLLGTSSLEEEFLDSGLVLDDKDPQAVVLSFDKSLTYSKLETAHRLILQGLPYVATHPDLVCPTLNGSIPDCGSFIALLKASTGREPVIAGKPYPILAKAASTLLKRETGRMMMIGDRLYTDMEMGVRCGVQTGLVLTGEATLKSLEESSYIPTRIFKGVFELLEHLKKEV